MNILYITIIQTLLLALYARVVLRPRNCDDDRCADRRDVLRIFDRFPTEPNQLFFVEACPDVCKKVSASKQ